VVRDYKKKTERLFAQFARMVYGHPFFVMCLGFGFIGFLAYQTFFIQINTASEALLHKDDPKRIQYNAFRTQFGRPELIIVMAQADEIFEPGFLNRLNSFHQTLQQEVPYVRSVTSLINVRDLRYDRLTISTEGLLEKWPDVDLKKIQARANASKLYENFILSEDGKTTAVIIETLARVGADNRFFGAKENEQVVSTVHGIIKQYNRPEFLLTASGEPVVEDAFNRATLIDLKICVSLSLMMVCFFLILLFKRVSGVFLSMMITVCTLISTMGLMALFGVQVKITTIVMPAFIVAVSVAASVHILVIFFRHHQKTGDKKEAIAFAMGHSGLAIWMTSLTTAVGLLSFSFAELVAIAEIGYLSAAGVMLAFFYTIFLLPAVLAIVPVAETNVSNKTPVLDRLLGSVARFSCAHHIKIIVSSFILLVLSVFFMFNLTFTHDLLRFFPESSRERQDILDIDKTMKGSLSLELVISNPDKSAFDLGTINRMDTLSEEIKTLEMDGISVGKVLSIVDVIKELNQAFNLDMSLFYLIPQDPKIIANGVKQLEGKSDTGLDRFIHQPSGGNRMTVVTTWTDAIIFKRFILKIEEKFNQIFNDGSEIVVTGIISLLAQATHAAIMSMVKSYAVAFVVITLMMILMLGQIKLGLVSMIPNLLPICIIMGLMGFLNTPFDLNSLMIGSIAIGLVVDDTVHFMYNFQKYHDQTGNVEESILATLLGTGKAMLITSLVLSSGFFVLLAATLSHVTRFGIYTGLVILVALLGDFLLAPALMMLIHGKKGAKG
jgi:uncharacterized protein